MRNGRRRNNADNCYTATGHRGERIGIETFAHINSLPGAEGKPRHQFGVAEGRQRGYDAGKEKRG